MKSDNRRAVAVHKFQAINELSNLLRVAAQHLNICPHLALAVFLTHEIGHGCTPAALVMREKFNVHGVHLSA